MATKHAIFGPKADLSTLVRAYFTQLRVVCRACTERRCKEQADELRRLEQAIERRLIAAASPNRTKVSNEDLAEWEQLARESGYRLNRMAELAGGSPRQLQRFFKTAFGCAPRDWMREVRCRHARTLIAKGYSSKAAASELCFATEAHFCREFKRTFGVTPQTYAPGRRNDREETKPAVAD